MRKKVKRVTAGFLAAIVVLGTPANLQKADAAGQRTMCVQGKEQEKERWISFIELETTEDRESIPEDISMEIQEPERGIVLEDISEDISTQSQESTSEIVPERVSEEIPGENQESTSEFNLDEGFEEESETASISGEAIPTAESKSPNKKGYIIKLDNAVIVPAITGEGVLDYRTYLDSQTGPQISIDLLEKVHEKTVRPKMQYDGINTRLIPREELSDISCQVTISDTDIVRAEGDGEGDFPYNLSADAVNLVVNGVGETDYEVRLLENDRYGAAPVSGKVTVKNSPLFDEDFYITVSGTDKQYTFAEWNAYLAAHNQWADGEISIHLSDTGKKYFRAVRISKGMADGEEESSPHSAGGKRDYVFWAENPERKASTRHVENGTRVFTAGIDMEAPLLRDFTVESKCFAPTRTETEQYFGQDFVLKGRFVDLQSGVKRVTYTTDCSLGENAVWAEAETISAADRGSLDFSITLRDGCYPAIAVRAYDHAGNVSETKGFVNENGVSVKVIVDKSEPVLNVRAMAGDKPYTGDDDNWTNRDIIFDIALDADSCPYAGIYQCAYLYQTIGDAVNSKNMTDMSENWTEIKLRENRTAKMEVTEDKNGYYCFRAVSKSGIMSKEIYKKRVLTQRQIPKIKPVIVGNADDAKRKNSWYNKESGVPVIRFAYPDYDKGVISKEYDAPVTIHYQLTARVIETENSAQEEAAAKPKEISLMQKSARIGVMGSSDVSEDADGVRTFVVTQDDLEKHVIDFRSGMPDRDIQDGIYTLEYWIADKAGNVSEKQKQVYKIDTHEPENLKVELDGAEFPVSQASAIVYEKFYQESVSGTVSAQYGISGKGSLTVLKAKKIGAWENAAVNEWMEISDVGVINIPPCTRCFLYVRAEDNAGNTAEGWTRGIVVDNLAPNQENGRELVMEPDGANKNGFYNKDVKVDILVRDAPENDNCAALMTVTGTVGKDGTDTFTDKELFSFTKELPTEEELDGAAGFSAVEVIDAKMHESNAAYIEVTATDRSGNTRTSAQLLKIDVTKPQIEIMFDNDNAVNGSFFNAARTATIQVHEQNFDPSAVDILVTRDGRPYEYQLSDWTSEGDMHHAAITFAEDGSYGMEVRCTDLADNESDIVKTPSFIIDQTAPVLTIKLESRQDNFFYEHYYQAAVTAVITVKERNFHENGFVLDNAAAANKGTWTHDGEVHTMRLIFDSDNVYHIACSYTDLAGNRNDTADPDDKAEADFVIDMIAPMIFIEGVADGSANSGVVSPVISVLDFHMEAQDTAITVTTGIGDIVQTTVETAPLEEETGIGYQYVLSDLTDKEDNIYYLTVTARDKSGNASTLTYRFSLNRKGSAYDLTQITELMERQYVTYTALEDIRIIEMNIDTVEQFELYVSRNGALCYSASYDKEIKGSAETGYTYIYHVGKDNFAEEGTYRISLYSRDRAGNEGNNMADIHGDEISFVVDNTPPKVVIDGIEAGMLYDAESQQVHVSVTDNFKLCEAELVLVNKANEVLDRWDYMALCEEGGQMDITIPQYNGELALLYRVKDAAGNEMQTFQGGQTALGDFLVTTDRFVQFLNKPSKTPQGRMTLILIGAALLAAVMIAIRKYAGRCQG